MKDRKHPNRSTWRASAPCRACGQDFISTDPAARTCAPCREEVRRLRADIGQLLTGAAWHLESSEHCTAGAAWRLADALGLVGRLMAFEDGNGPLVAGNIEHQAGAERR